MSTCIVDIVDNGDGTYTLTPEGGTSFVTDDPGLVVILSDGTVEPYLSIDGLDIGVLHGIGGVSILFDRVDGWHGGPPTKTGFVERPQGHGAFDAPAYRGSRVVTASGWAYGDSRTAVAAAMHSLTSVLATGELGDFTVHDADYGTLSAAVRLSDGPLIDWNATRFAWAWQVQVTAPDPRKYAAAQILTTGLPAAGSGGGLEFPLFADGFLDFGSAGGSTGRVVLSNPGTADAWPSFTVTGPVLGGLSLTDAATGRAVVYAGDVAAGASLVLDFADGSARLNGSDRSGELTSRLWWPVPARGESVVQFATPGASGQSGTLAAQVRAAYW